MLINVKIWSSVVECLTQDRGAEPLQRHCVVSLSKNVNPSLVLVQSRKTRLFISENLVMGLKESIKQTNVKMPTIVCIFYFLKANQFFIF